MYFGGLLWWRTYPNVLIASESLAGYYEQSVESSSTSFGLNGTVTGEHISGTVDVQITGAGTIIVNHVTVTVGGNQIWLTSEHSPFGQTLQLPAAFYVNVLREGWIGPASSSSVTLTITFDGYWSPIGGTPNLPVTLTGQETVQWVVAGSPP